MSCYGEFVMNRISLEMILSNLSEAFFVISCTPTQINPNCWLCSRYRHARVQSVHARLKMEASVGESEGTQGRGQWGWRFLWRYTKAAQQGWHLQVEAAVANRHPGVARTYYISHHDRSIAQLLNWHTFHWPLLCSVHGQFFCRAVVHGLQHKVATNPVAGQGCKLIVRHTRRRLLPIYSRDCNCKPVTISSLRLLCLLL